MNGIVLILLIAATGVVPVVTQYQFQQRRLPSPFLQYGDYRASRGLTPPPPPSSPSPPQSPQQTSQSSILSPQYAFYPIPQQVAATNSIDSHFGSQSKNQENQRFFEYPDFPDYPSGRPPIPEEPDLPPTEQELEDDEVEEATEKPKKEGTVYKHISVHVAPEDLENDISEPRVVKVLKEPEKHVKLIFIKPPETPRQPTELEVAPPPQPKTLVYVLSSATAPRAPIKFVRPAPVPPLPPQVFFLRWKPATIAAGAAPPPPPQQVETLPDAEPSPTPTPTPPIKLTQPLFPDPDAEVIRTVPATAPVLPGFTTTNSLIVPHASTNNAQLTSYVPTYHPSTTSTNPYFPHTSYTALYQLQPPPVIPFYFTNSIQYHHQPQLHTYQHLQVQPQSPSPSQGNPATVTGSSNAQTTSALNNQDSKWRPVSSALHKAPLPALRNDALCTNSLYAQCDRFGPRPCLIFPCRVQPIFLSRRFY